MKCKFIFSALCSLSLWLGCWPQTEPQNPGELIIAQVGKTSLSGNDLADFGALIPASMKKGDTALERNSNLLNSLVDKHLLLQEAEAADIASSTEYLEELARFEKRNIRQLYEFREIVSKIQLTPEEIDAHYRATRRDRTMRLGGIMVESEVLAQSILAQLEKDGDFAQLAKKHSIHDSAERGGDTGLYQMRDELSENVAAKVAHLDLGQYSQPVLMFEKNRPVHVIFSILDEMPAPLEASEAKIRAELMTQKRNERLKTLLDSLETAYQPKLADAQIALIADISTAAGDTVLEIDKAKWDLPICTYKDESGKITLGQFAQSLRQMQLGTKVLADTARVAFLLRTRIIPEVLFMREISDSGLGQDPQLQADLAKKSEELLLEGLRRQAIDQYITVTKEEARQFYDENPIKFTKPLTTTLVEILVGNDSLAQTLKQRLEAGEDPEALSAAYTIRKGGHHKKPLEINRYNRVYFPDIHKSSEGLEIGQVGGPLRTKDGYSVFKILSRDRTLSPYDKESQRRSGAYVRIQKAKMGYVKYVKSLRKTYPVEINQENLATFSGGPNP